MAKEHTTAIRTEEERALKLIGSLLEPFNFARTRKREFIRDHDLTVDFVHFHRMGISYGGSPSNFSVEFRIHFGIRVLNDEFEALELNGPYSDSTRLRDGRYHLRFNAKTGSQFQRTVDDAIRFIEEVGEPWFLKFHKPEMLLKDPDFPLDVSSQNSLRSHMEGEFSLKRVSASYKLLGIKRGMPEKK